MTSNLFWNELFLLSVRLSHPLPREAFTSALLCTSLSHCLNAGTADRGTTFLIPFYISLGRATVPVRINIIISLGWVVFWRVFCFFVFLWRSVCSLPHFLVVLATAIKLKLQEVEGLPCLLLKRRESCGLRYRLTCGIHRVAALLWVRSAPPNPSPLLCPPIPPHSKISAHF